MSRATKPAKDAKPKHVADALNALPVPGSYRRQSQATGTDSSPEQETFLENCLKRVLGGVDYVISPSTVPTAHWLYEKISDIVEDLTGLSAVGTLSVFGNDDEPGTRTGINDLFTAISESPPTSTPALSLETQVATPGKKSGRVPLSEVGGQSHNVPLKKKTKNSSTKEATAAGAENTTEQRSRPSTRATQELPQQPAGATDGDEVEGAGENTPSTGRLSSRKRKQPEPEVVYDSVGSQKKQSQQLTKGRAKKLKLEGLPEKMAGSEVLSVITEAYVGLPELERPKFVKICRFFADEVFSGNGVERFSQNLRDVRATVKDDKMVTDGKKDTAEAGKGEALTQMRECEIAFRGLRARGSNNATKIREELTQYVHAYEKWSVMYNTVLAYVQDKKDPTGLISALQLYSGRLERDPSTGVSTISYLWEWLVDQNVDPTDLDNEAVRESVKHMLRDELAGAQRVMVLRNTFGPGIFLFLPANSISKYVYAA